MNYKRLFEFKRSPLLNLGRRMWENDLFSSVFPGVVCLAIYLGFVNSVTGYYNRRVENIPEKQIIQETNDLRFLRNLESINRIKDEAWGVSEFSERYQDDARFRESK